VDKRPRAQEITERKPRPKWHGRRKGLFHPNNPEKYDGDVENIVYRSGIELRLMKYLDSHPSILKWSSEETVIPYVSPKDGKYHRYFVDVKATLKQKDESVKTYLIEVKWSTATVPPKAPKKRTKRYLREAYDWMINQAKWEAAEKLCQKKGWEWLILTEKHLNL
jgi:hypothetical protein